MADKLYEKYKKFISGNAETCSDMETLLKFVGYFVSGKYTKISLFHSFVQF
jgi:hypothetical protein